MSFDGGHCATTNITYPERYGDEPALVDDADGRTMLFLLYYDITRDTVSFGNGVQNLAWRSSIFQPS